MGNSLSPSLVKHSTGCRFCCNKESRNICLSINSSPGKWAAVIVKTLGDEHRNVSINLNLFITITVFLTDCMCHWLWITEIFKYYYLNYCLNRIYGNDTTGTHIWICLINLPSYANVGFIIRISFFWSFQAISVNVAEVIRLNLVKISLCQVYIFSQEWHFF